VLNEVTITLWFCRERDPEVCAKLPRISRYFARASFTIDLNSYSSIDEIVDEILDSLEERFRRSLGNIPHARDVAIRWREKIEPYIYEAVFEALLEYLRRLWDLWRMCREGVYVERESLVEPIVTPYPSLSAEVDFDAKEMVCDESETALSIIERYREAVRVTGMGDRAFIAFKIARMPECRGSVVKHLLDNVTPLEELMDTIPNADWCYEVYYHA